jgi:hypothetical protein
LVIAVLAIIWVVCLTPMMLRKLSERRFTNSVDSFHRQLRGLRRAYPRLAASAADPGTEYFTSESLEEDLETRYSARAYMQGDYSLARQAPRVSLQTARRRRVLLVLVGAMLGFFVLGVIPPLRILWGLSLLAFAAVASYIALLIYIHRRAVERRVKVVDIRDLRKEAGLPEHMTGASRRRLAEEVEWGDDDLADAGYDYDEIMSGGR